MPRGGVKVVWSHAVLAGIALLCLFTTAAVGEELSNPKVVGVLANAPSMNEPILASFLQRLGELGYVEGRNLKIEFRSARNQPTRLPRLAQELTRLKPDAIFVTSTLAASELKRATSTIPLVMIGNPMDADLIVDLAHPGANLTGFSIVSSELTAKRLQLLKEAVPKLRRVAVLWNSNELWTGSWVENLKGIAPSLSLELTPMMVRTPEELESTFGRISRTKMQAVYLMESPLFFIHREKVIDLASRARLPVIFAVRELTVAGGLMSYGPSYDRMYRGAAEYIDKILKGAKPGDLPVEQPTQFQLVVNLRTARALGIKLPESVLRQADEVIQ